MNTQKAAIIRAKLVDNVRTGKHPQSMQEMREMDADRVKAEERAAAEEECLNIPLDTVAQEYLVGLNESTQKANTSRYNNHIKPIFGNTPLRNIDPLSLERFKRKLFKKGLAPKTVHHTLTIIRTIYRKAVAWDYYNGPIPTSKIEFPKFNNKRLRFLTYDEADLLLKALAERSLRTRDQALIALQCGLRSGEIRAMKWGDLDFKNGIITLPDTKVGESQQAFMPEEVKEVLLDRIPRKVSSDAYVFPGKVGKKQFKISDTFKRTVFDLGLNEGVEDTRNKVVFHSLRHTFCSWLAMQGTPLFTIQQLARHKSLAMTERYSHLLPDHKQDAVKAMAEVFDRHRNASAELQEDSSVGIAEEQPTTPQGKGQRVKDIPSQPRMRGGG
jgi:integrase